MNLDADQLLEILKRGEGRQSEFKRGLPRDEKTARTLAAFANTRGGMLFVGVHDDGRVHGVPRPREVTARLREICAHGIEPPLAVELRTVELADGAVVCCSVPLSGARPHAVLHARGEPEVVVRVGASNRLATGASLRALREDRTSRKSLGPLEKQVLAWVGERNRRAKGSRQPGGDATVKAFAQARNVGVQRARRAFVQLERDGHLVAHGFGAQRVYALA
jgi:hypothetical protein